MAAAAAPAGDWDNTLDITISVKLVGSKNGGRRMHAPDFTLLREQAEAFVRGQLVGKATPYVIEAISSVGSYGYTFEV
jgi:hypothetical protein